MKKLIMILLLLSFTAPSLAATVGSPEMGIPEESLFLKETAVKKALDQYEYNLDIKASLEIEVINEKDLSSSPADVSSAELEGQNYMVKLSTNFYDVFQPYIKIGTSDLEVRWVQHAKDVKVESDPGLLWAAGAKAKLWEFEDSGLKLSMDCQYRHFDSDVDKSMLGGSVQDAAAANEHFEINEWQASLLASKKYILPLGRSDIYLVPYTGLTYTSSDIDVSFQQGTSGLLYSTYEACDENPIGVVFGCDIMPFFLSYYLLNFEARFLNETALTLGGTIKF